MTALSKAHEANRQMVEAAYQRSMQLKQAGLLPIDGGGGSSSGMGLFGSSGNKNQQYYRHFRGWAYSAINALASHAASQPVLAGKKYTIDEQRAFEGLKGHDLKRAKKSSADRKRRAQGAWQKMPAQLKAQYSQVGELEVLPDHPVLAMLEHPNDIQHRWQFVYTFIANLCITGWGYLIGGKGKDGKLELYSIPTTWIEPDHSKGPFSQFRLKSPDNMGEGVLIPRENVAFAHLPNPLDLRDAVSPVGSQIQAIRIDDHIQTSQDRFFENGIFPSMIVEIGKDPHPDVPGGLRPRLSPEQRRQVIGAVRKVLGGVANMGAPAIVDGLIENIRPMSFSQREMGWEKSEDKIRVRILSAFGVHPYILGEPINIGGYAQAAKIEERFCTRVNVYLNMLSSLITTFVSPMVDTNQVTVWWEEMDSHDPSIYWQNIRNARSVGDITKNEHRALLGLSDMTIDEDGYRNRLLDNTSTMSTVLNLMDRVGNGSTTVESAVEYMVMFLEITEEQARSILEGNLPSASAMPVPAPNELPEE